MVSKTKSIEITLTEEEVKNLASLNSGYGKILFEAIPDGFVQIFNPVLVWNKTGGILTDKDYLILGNRDLFMSTYSHVSDCNNYPVGFVTAGLEIRYKINDNIYLTCGGNNPDYQGTATFICDYKIIKF